MKKLLIILFIFGWGNLANATIAYVSGTCASQSNTYSSFTTSPINTTGASLIVVSLGHYTPGSGGNTLTDSQSNSWTQLNAYTDGGSQVTGRLYYVSNPSTSSSHTFTYGGSFTDYPHLCVYAFSGTLTSSSPFDQQNGGTNYGAGAYSVATGNITPAYNNEVLVTGFSVNVAENASIPSGYTGTTGASNGAAMAYLIQTTATSSNPTWSVASNGNMEAGIASFQSASGGTISQPPLTTTGGLTVQGNLTVQ